jgi:Putative beta-barrel porin-2, OmpL-like. bbp2
MDIRTSAWLVLSLLLSSALASGQQPDTYESNVSAEAAYDRGADLQAMEPTQFVGGDCTSQCTSPYMPACDTCSACGACNACNACNACEPWRLCTQCPDGEGINLYGWLDAGFVGNTSSPASKFNGPYNAVDRANEGMFNQLYLIAEQKLPSDGCHGIGGRVDVNYGEDFFLAQSVGMENHDDGSPHWNPQYYGLAVPQAYVEMGRSDLSIKVGHFYSPIGL